MKGLEKLNFLINQIENNPHAYTPFQTLRQNNLIFIKNLFFKLEISKSHEDFESLFHYKAMNLAGISLKDKDFSNIQKGKYVQIISIEYQENKEGKKVAKNKSLAYFGKSEKLNLELKNNIIEFVLRWREEKLFRQLENYSTLRNKLKEINEY